MKYRNSNRGVVGLIVASLCAMLLGCGGGSGLGPAEIKQREDRLKDRLPIDWDSYNTGDYTSAIDFFTSTLQEADQLEGVEGVKNQIKSEAQNGIGWAFFRLQNLAAAQTAFDLATRFDRGNADAWVGFAGVALALQAYNDAVQYAIQALERDNDYSSGTRLDEDGRKLGHDRVDERHVRLMLAEAYFHLGRYNATDRPDPSNAAAQLLLVRSDYRFRDVGHLIETLSQVSIELQETLTEGS